MIYRYKSSIGVVDVKVISQWDVQQYGVVEVVSGPDDTRGTTMHAFAGDLMPILTMYPTDKLNLFRCAEYPEALFTHDEKLKWFCSHKAPFSPLERNFVIQIVRKIDKAGKIH